MQGKLYPLSTNLTSINVLEVLHSRYGRFFEQKFSEFSAKTADFSYFCLKLAEIPEYRVK